MLEDSAARGAGDRAGAGRQLPRVRRGTAGLLLDGPRRDRRDGAVDPPASPGGGRSSRQPRLRDLHLGLDGHARRGWRSSTAAPWPAPIWARRSSRGGPGSWLAATAVLRSTSVASTLSVETCRRWSAGKAGARGTNALELPQPGGVRWAEVVLLQHGALGDGPELVRTGRRSASGGAHSQPGRRGAASGPLVEPFHEPLGRACGCSIVYGPIGGHDLRHLGGRRRRDGAAVAAIGRPIAGTQALRARPPAASRCRSGCPGELLLGGAGLARGYLHRPELTAERFVPDPFSEAGGEPGGAALPDGDLARYLPDGSSGVPGPDRPAGQGAGLPHRAGRGGGGAAGARRGARGGGAGAGGPRRRPSAGGVRGDGARARSRRASCGST